MPEKNNPPITVNVVPWTPLEREEFDRHLNEETAERLWAEISKIKERQPEDAKGWRVRFADRPDLGGMKVEVEWQTKRLSKKIPDDGKGWSPNSWFYIASNDMLKGAE